MGYSRAGGKLIQEKNQEQKISWHCPFKEGLTQDFRQFFSWISVPWAPYITNVIYIYYNTYHNQRMLFKIS